VLVVALGDRDTSEFAARGGETQPVTGAEVMVYQVEPHGAVPVRDRIDSSAPLAFAYTNPAGARYLLIFGRGADGRIHWYYPEWSDARENPAAVPILGNKE